MGPPIFIIGNARSGTTLLRLMMTCHKNILIPPECSFAVWWREKYGPWSGGGPVTDTYLAAFVNDLMSSRKFETWQLGREQLMESLRARRPSSYPEAVSAIYQCFGAARGRSFGRWGDKNNVHLHHIAELHEMFPTARFVHIIRDGRNVACSYLALHRSRTESRYAPRLPQDLRGIAEEWRNNVLIARRGFDAIGWSAVHEIRFEDLVTRAEGTLRTLCSFLAEEYDVAMLAYDLANRTGELEPSEFLQWKSKTLLPLLPRETTRYVDELTPGDQELFEGIAGDILQLYRYR